MLYWTILKEHLPVASPNFMCGTQIVGGIRVQLTAGRRIGCLDVLKPYTNHSTSTRTGLIWVRDWISLRVAYHYTLYQVGFFAHNFDLLLICWPPYLEERNSCILSLYKDVN